MILVPAWLTSSGRVRPFRRLWGYAFAVRVCARRVHPAPGRAPLETPKAATRPEIGAEEEEKEEDDKRE